MEFSIVVCDSCKVFDVIGGNIIQSTWSGSDSQRWYLDTGTKDNLYGYKYYVIRNKENEKQVLDIQGGKCQDNVNIIQKSYDKNCQSQLWRIITNKESGHISIVSKLDESYCMSVPNKESGVSIVLSKINEKDSTKQELEIINCTLQLTENKSNDNDNINSVVFVASHSNMVIEERLGKLVQAPFNPKEKRQQWTISDVPSASRSNNVNLAFFFVVNFFHNGQKEMK